AVELKKQQSNRVTLASTLPLYQQDAYSHYHNQRVFPFSPSRRLGHVCQCRLYNRLQRLCRCCRCEWLPVHLPCLVSRHSAAHRRIILKNFTLVIEYNVSLRHRDRNGEEQ
ncbi:hypothetical protein TcCL_Unassigned07260, partial [Trypanosoma cruzi]